MRIAEAYASTEVSPAAHAPSPRLVHAAHEFEASLMQEFLKPLTEDPLFSSGDSDAGSESSHGSNSTLMSFGTQALAQALSQRGGMGIASKVLHNLGGRELETAQSDNSKMNTQR